MHGDVRLVVLPGGFYDSETHLNSPSEVDLMCLLVLVAKLVYGPAGSKATIAVAPS